MGRQPFRQMKSDGTMEEAGASGGGGSNDYSIVYSPHDWRGSNYNYRHSIGRQNFVAGNSNQYYTMTADDNLFMYRFVGPESGTVSEFSVYVGTADSASNLLVGIYSDDDGIPGTRLGYASIPMSGSGFRYQSSITGTITLVRGTQYWLVWGKDDDEGTPRLLCSYSSEGNPVPQSNPIANSNLRYYLRTSSNYTSLPSDFSSVTLKGYYQHPYPLNVGVKMT